MKLKSERVPVRCKSCWMLYFTYKPKECESCGSRNIEILDPVDARKQFNESIRMGSGRQAGLPEDCMRRLFKL